MDGESSFSRVTIIGVGLMGGSFGLALKNFYPRVTVTGVDYKRQVEIALDRGAIDESYPPAHLGRGVEGSDLVVVATPIDGIIRLTTALSGQVDGGAVVLDLGSTKEEICRTGWEAFSDSTAEFVGGHPMTGAEVRGMEGAHPLLYENSVFVLSTPNGEPTEGSQKLEVFLRRLGTHPHYLSPERHDQLVARISHLPQLVAVGLMRNLENSPAGREDDSAEEYLSFAGGGFKDMTRIAGSPFEVWEDILATNSGRIKEEIELFIGVMERLGGLVGEEDMGEDFSRASALRREVPASNKGISSRMVKVAVMVPDRPGALAELTSSVAEEGINVKDLELQKVREDYGGTFHVYFESREDAAAACTVMNANGFDSRVID
ncbi:MAG: prephenate dehydrogenase/arogenate dehydrogenase family protein [Candidatus Acetothermia bacterium]